MPVCKLCVCVSLLRVVANSVSRSSGRPLAAAVGPLHVAPQAERTELLPAHKMEQEVRPLVAEAKLSMKVSYLDQNFTVKIPVEPQGDCSSRKRGLKRSKVALKAGS